MTESRVAQAPRVSILIRCRDEAASLGPVLAAVEGQRGAPPFEVVALDSGSRDGTLEVLARHPVRIEHLAGDTWSYGRALNRAAELARAPLLVYLSAHCRPVHERWLAALVRPFGDPAVVATFGRQTPVPYVNPIEAIATLRNFPDAPPAGVRFSTANGAVRRDAVLARPFDEEIPIAEDHLWACGIADDARIVYVPEAEVAHSHPMGLAHWRARFYAHGLALVYARKRRGVELPWDAGGGSAPGIALGRGGAFLRLAGGLVARGELRSLAHLPAYAVARTIWFARGVRDGERRWGTA